MIKWLSAENMLKHKLRGTPSLSWCVVRDRELPKEEKIKDKGTNKMNDNLKIKVMHKT